ncbi:hypothetical protein Cni_G08365 [Canna indica]|uniref:Uncharacterized protein n=1 Tax=Canna indica TaxID=4628 RepID=A0AAQ3Q6Q8_9LILI|nr:hypothetical protein Cni_G08365 [Canna indica]
MATKVQSKSYLPGYYSMQDIKEDATSSWSSYFQEKKLTEHIYDTYVPRLVNGYSEHDKEMLKRTMLEHEAIFKKQVYELHRLYRIQKDLMDDIQTRGFHRSLIPQEASHSNSFSSQRQSKHSEKMAQMSHLPVGNTSYGKIPFAITERSHVIFKREDNVQSAQIPLLSGASQNDAEADNVQSARIPLLSGASQNDAEAVDYKPQKKRTFDLQLPADVYIDIEDSDGSGQMNIAEPSYSASIYKNGTSPLYSENDMKLTVGNSQKVGCQVLNSVTRIDKSACGTVDLNEPTTKVSSESPATQLHGLKANNDYNQEHYSSIRSNTTFMTRHGDQQMPSDLLHRDIYTKGGWPFFNHESGKNRIALDKFAHTSCYNIFPTSSEAVQLNTKKCRESFSFDHNSPDTWSRHEPTHEIQTSIRFPHFTCSNSALISPSVLSAITTPQADLTSCTSSFVSSWRKPSSSKSSMPISGQTLPCFSGSSSNLSNESMSSKIDAQSPISYCQKWQSSRNMTTIVGTDIALPRADVFRHGLHLESHFTQNLKDASCKLDQTDCKGNLHGHLRGNHVKSFRITDLNLNQAFPSGIEDGPTFNQDPVYCDVYDKLSGGSSWLKKTSCGKSVDVKKTSRVDFCFSSGHTQLPSSSNVVAPEIERKEEKELDFSVCNQQEVASTLQFKHHKMQGSEVSDRNGKGILCVPIDDKNEQSSLSVSTGHAKKHLTGNTKFAEYDNRIFTDLSCDTKMFNSQKKIHIGDRISEISGAKSSASLSCINLNAELPYTDDPVSSAVVPQCEVGVQPSKSISIFGAKIASDTDMEAPDSQDEMVIVNQKKSIPTKKDGSEKKDYSCDTLVRLAADNLVAISKDINGHTDEIGSHLLSLPQFDTLCWFAEVVSCTGENPNPVGNGRDGLTLALDDHDDGLDLFEVMTLKLQDIKADCCTPRQVESKDDNEKEGKEFAGVASLLFTKPRRGQARKRRQRRDFQKDILPGLASLSRLEVSEDLQTIGGMMKASGRHWQTGPTRRCAGRNGMNSQTKGRRQPRSLAITVEEQDQVIDCQPSQHSNPEIGGVDGSKMIGWGRTTRRCRRQRCISGSLPAPLV